MKRFMGLALAGALSVGFALPAQATPSPAEPSVPVDEPSMILDEGNDIIKVIVMLKGSSPSADPAESAAAVQAVVNRWNGRDGVSVRRQFGTLVRGFSASLPANVVAALEADPAVESVSRMAMFEPSMATAGQLTGSVQAREKLGVDGRGLLVSVIDSGMDIAHQDFRLDAGVEKKMAPQPGWTDKIPYGWNFADDSANVKDSGSEHGQHVAGIIGANAGAATTDAAGNWTGRINGIAPNAQLLAMKVFSNDPINGGGASEDDVIAAIEKSVELGADIINMSLGSPNGVNQGGVGEGRAIAAAAAKGVQVIVAAGNEGLNWSAKADMVDDAGKLDNGTLGNPSSTPGAISVASVNNSFAVADKGVAQWNGGRLEFGYQKATGTMDGAPHEIVDCGKGATDGSDVPAAANGKWCLIQRGGNTFAEKFAAAQAKGAVGVLVYNNAGEAFVGMGGLDAVTIPGASVFQSVGEAIKADIDKGMTVTLTHNKGAFPNKDAVLPSDFTSFGGTPELAFKPQIAGIGGAVYSLANDNGYQNMSGTSMATPHVAGIYALGLQEYKKRFPALAADERGKLLTTALSNTSQILQVDNVPLSPRQMGAGLAQTDKALATSVYATVDGSPTVALRQVSGPQTFTVTLENKGTAPQTYKAGGTCVVNEVAEAGKPLRTTCSSEGFAVSAPQVTVPAGGKATVDVTVTPAAGNHWIGGWATFTPVDAAQPELAVPYLGFAGDWNAEPIIDKPRELGKNEQFISQILGTTSHSNYTQLYSNDDGLRLSRVGGSAWFSPNGDGHFDSIYPALMLLRSARDLSFSVVDAQGNVLRELGTDVNRQRSILSKIAKGSRVISESAHAWDGTLYDATKDAFVPVPDGSYAFRVKARLAEDMPWQTIDMPFNTDTVAPTMKVTRAQTGTSWGYTLTFDDGNGSGVSSLDVTVTSAQTGRKIPVRGGLNGTMTFMASESIDGPYVKISYADRAGNPGERYEFLGADGVTAVQAAALAHPINLKSVDPATGKPFIKADRTIDLVVAASPTIATVTVDGIAAPVANGKAVVTIPATEGRVEHAIVGLDAAGKQLATASQVITVDTIAPTFTLTKAPLDDQGRLILDANGEAVIEGKIADERASMFPPALPNGDMDLDNQLWLLDGSLSPILDGINADGTFTLTVKPEASDQFVSLYVLDWFDFFTYKFLNLNGVRIPLARPATVDASSPDLRIMFDEARFDGAAASQAGPGQPFGDSVYLLDKTYKGLEVNGDKATLTLSGRFNRPAGDFLIQGKKVAVDANNHFSVTLPLTEGITTVGYEVHEVDGSLITMSAWKFLYDRKAPGYELTTTPQVAADGAIWLTTPTATVDVAGSVWDGEFGYTMAVNGNVVKDSTQIWDPVANQKRAQFATKVDVADGQFMRLSLNDFAGNGLERTIPILSDLVDPTLTVDPATLGAAPIAATQKIVVTAADTHLRDLQVTVDGKPAGMKMTSPAPAPGAKLVVTNVGDPTQPDEITIPGGATPGAVATPSAAPKAKAAPAAKATTRSVDAYAAADPTPAETTLVVEVAPQAAGKHLLVATATDLAGRTTTINVPFLVDAAPVITGNDTVTINPDDGAALAQLQKLFPVTDDVDKGLLVAADTSVLRLDETVPVTLTVTDSAGNVTTRTVNVLLQRPMTTLTGACGSMTARFAKGDVISIECVKNPDGTTTVTVGHTSDVEVDGTLALSVAGPIRLVGANGSLGSPLTTTLVDGKVTFTSPARATYVAGDPVASDPKPNPGPGAGEVPAPVTPDEGTPGAPAVRLPGTGAPAGLLGLALLGGCAVAAGVGALRRK